jgi:hypothetical protein
MKTKKKIRFRFFSVKDGKVLAIVEPKKRRGYKGNLVVVVGKAA